MTASPLLGLHHVTAIASDPQRNLDFYTGVLGMRLVKLTVNFDDPSSYHLYYGDSTGRPGSILTFFAYDGRPGTLGRGQATSTAMSIPGGSLTYWRERLAAHGVAYADVDNRLGEPVATLTDPDGLKLELVERDEIDEKVPWLGQSVPADRAISGLHSVTIPVAADDTSIILDRTFGWEMRAVDGTRTRYQGEKNGAIDLISAPSTPFGRVAIGSVHHVAFRVRTEDAQAAWREKLIGIGTSVSPFMERDYFRSIYFREPGGVLFEIATDGPGFAIDEPADRLGTGLMLPKHMESSREGIERALPALDLVQPTG